MSPLVTIGKREKNTFSEIVTVIVMTKWGYEGAKN